MSFPAHRGILFLLLLGYGFRSNRRWLDSATENISNNSVTTKIPEDNTVNSTILPSKMETHYYEMWNHTTSTIDVPKKYKNPFGLATDDNPPPPTSLEILHSVLHNNRYKAEFEAVDAYIDGKSTNIPSCLLPNLKGTQELAQSIVQKRNQRPSNNSSAAASPLILPEPILNVGFPKAGSTTLNYYFGCSKITAVHGRVGEGIFERLKDGTRSLLPGIDKRMRFRKRPRAFSGMQAFTQLDWDRGKGHFPQISLLDELHEQHPNSTLVIVFRPIPDWIKSTTDYSGMKERFAEFDMPGLVLEATQRQRLEDYRANKIPQKDLIGLSDVQMARWWCGHVLHIREYVKAYPGHALIELDLYDTEGSEELLQDLFRADSDPNGAETCFGHRNKKQLSPEQKARRKKRRERKKQEKASAAHNTSQTHI